MKKAPSSMYCGQPCFCSQFETAQESVLGSDSDTSRQKGVCKVETETTCWGLAMTSTRQSKAGPV